LKASKVLKGNPASPGISIGKAFLVDEDHINITTRQLKKNEIDEEIEKFKSALNETEKDINEIKKRFSGIIYDKGDIFEAHLQILRDDSMIKKTISKLKDEKKNIDFIFYNLMVEIQNKLLNSNDEYLRERAQDIKDLKRRVIRKIQGKKFSSSIHLEDESIIVARILTPFDAVTLDKSKALGFAIERGGITSHAMILARSLNIPSVVGVADLFKNVKPDDIIILNGYNGDIIINPSQKLLKSYKKLQTSLKEKEKELKKIVHLPAVTLDGKEIELSANIELPYEADHLVKVGAQGVGLYRTEYLYLTEKVAPSEEAQFKIYEKIAKATYPEPVIIRTIDLGGDKLFTKSYSRERNPFLGWRAIRVCLSNKKVFKDQLRAILRASVLKNIKILLPFISNLNEVLESKKILEEVKQELRTENIEFDKNIELGIMIEIPSSVLIADHLAKEVDFFSIGTNDLIQYTLAVDRMNHKISDLYQSYHPAVLRLIKDTIDAGHRNNIWVGLCGEMAAMKSGVPVLIGFGIDELSVSPVFIPQVKEIIRSIKYEDVKNLAKECLKFKSAEEIENFIKAEMYNRLPYIFDESFNHNKGDI